MDTRHTDLACMLSEKERFGRDLAYNMFAKYLRYLSSPAKQMMVTDVRMGSHQTAPVRQSL